MKKLYIGNLSYDVTEDELRELFEEQGTVLSVNIIKDKFDNSSKGFGFIEMEDGSAADDAISTLDGNDFRGRELRVSEARAKTEGGDRGRGGRDRRGGGNNYGGGEHRGGGNNYGGGRDRRGGGGRSHSGNSGGNW